MMNDVLNLIAHRHKTDEFGDPVMVEDPREVFARLDSIGQREFYQGHAVGLKPELKFVLADYLDYEGETHVEHEGIRYRVLRTYRTGTELELIVYREVNSP